MPLTALTAVLRSALTSTGSVPSGPNPPPGRPSAPAVVGLADPAVVKEAVAGLADLEVAVVVPVAEGLT